MNSQHSLVHSQRGAVLAVSLVFLVLLTLTGLTAMRVAGLEEKMAGNLRNWNIAFQAAEAALRDGEASVQQGIFTGETGLQPGGGCSSGTVDSTFRGMCSQDPTASKPYWATLDWTDSASPKRYVLYGTHTGASNLGGVATQPRFTVEPNKLATAGQDMTVPPTYNGPVKAFTYRLTGLGYGGNNLSYAMLQSTFYIPQ